MTTGGDERGRDADPVVDLRLETVARRAASGDRAALARVYEELSPAVLGYVRARGASDPESVTSEVFVQVIRCASSMPPSWQGVRTYVFRAAHSRLVDDHRRSRTRGVHVDYDPAHDGRRVASAEESALGGLALTGVLGLLDLLPTDQRAVVTLRFVADLSLQQTADVMGRSPSWVGHLQSTALGTLRSYLADPDQPEPREGHHADT